MRTQSTGLSFRIIQTLETFSSNGITASIVTRVNISRAGTGLAGTTGLVRAAEVSGSTIVTAGSGIAVLTVAADIQAVGGYFTGIGETGGREQKVLVLGCVRYFRPIPIR